jgi:mRNA interferase MazF
MPTCDRFEVAVVPFPFVDTPAVKRRPALALTAAAFARTHGHGVFAMITTAKRSAWPSDIPLAAWREAGLTAPSVLRWKLFTLPEAAVVDRLGRLAAGDEKEVARGLALLLGLAPPAAVAPATTP